MDSAKKRQPKCHVCLTPYTYNGPEPHVLPCLHSVCCTCLNSDVNYELTCFACQETFQRVDFDFPKDAVRANEILLTTAKYSPSEVLCTNREDGNQAKSWCQKCEAFLCETCQEYHKVMKVSRNHAVISLKSFVASGVGIGVTAACCQDHDKQAELFDETCNQLVCYKCLKEKHNTCKVEETDTTYGRLKESQLKEGMKSLTGKLDDIGDVQVKIQDLSSKLDPQMKKVRETVVHTFNELRNALNQREEEVLSQLEPCFTAIKENNAARNATLEQERTRCKAALEFIEGCLELPDHAELLKMKEAINSRTKACSEAVLPKVQNRESFINFLQADVQDLKEFISTFGEYYSSISAKASNEHLVKGKVSSLKSLQGIYREKIHCLDEQVKKCTKKLENIAELIDESRDAGTIQLTFEEEDIVDIDRHIFSETLIIKNIPWYISIVQREGEDASRPQKDIGIYLYCDKSSAGNWSCDVMADFKVNKQQSDGHESSLEHTFTDDAYEGYGFPRFISTEKLLDPQNGYLENGTITIEANVVVKHTTGMLGLHDLLKQECSLNGKQLST